MSVATSHSHDPRPIREWDSVVHYVRKLAESIVLLDAISRPPNTIAKVTVVDVE